MSSNALCPKCGKPIERSEGKPCPYCGAIITEAIISLDNAEPVATPPATAITAKFPLKTNDEVTCPRCGKRFDAMINADVSWLSCPFCHEVNPAALVRRKAGAQGADVSWGCLLVGLGFVAVTLGSFCIGLGMALRHLGRRDEPQFVDSAITLIWAVASVAVMVTGIFLMWSKQRILDRSFWGPGALFLILMLLGFAGWIFAFSTCTILTN